jgi:single-stranded-DNA-specific exonuclease
MYLHGSRKTILSRPVGHQCAALPGVDPVLARIYAGRGVQSSQELERGLQNLPSPWLLNGMSNLTDFLVAALERQQRLTIVADFDADGATSCALALRGLALLGLKHVNFVVPNRFEDGYGLSPEIVTLALPQSPDILLTVDNGISSIEGVEAAKKLGIKVLITDHHLPGNRLPDADAIVNPNMPGDTFPSRNLAGVGVMFYVLMALRIRLRERHWFEKQRIPEPNLAQLLDYVALGTVADVAILDQVNRVLVHQGLLRMRSGQCHVGIKALVAVAGKNLAHLRSGDLGFSVAPRLNAAGRMDDMSLGIQCLLTSDEGLANEIAAQLDALNRDRKEVEGQMKHEALILLDEMKALDESKVSAGVCLYDAHWHQGVIGILASRIKDRLHRPVVAFAPGDDGELKGSARSIAGLHIRDVLAEIAAKHPGLLLRFGGHAMAAGLTIKLRDYPQFALQFTEVVAEKLQHIDLQQKIYSDGELGDAQLNLNFAEQLVAAATWGHGFPEPVFHGDFDVVQLRIVGQQHLKLILRPQNSQLLIDAIAFFADKPEAWQGCRKVRGAFSLDVNEYRQQRNLQLQMIYLEKLQ